LLGFIEARADVVIYTPDRQTRSRRLSLRALNGIRAIARLISTPKRPPI